MFATGEAEKASGINATEIMLKTVVAPAVDIVAAAASSEIVSWVDVEDGTAVLGSRIVSHLYVIFCGRREYVEVKVDGTYLLF